MEKHIVRNMERCDTCTLRAGLTLPQHAAVQYLRLILNKKEPKDLLIIKELKLFN